MSDASATLIGNVTREPELRFTQSGMATCTFGLAVNYRRQNRQTGEWDETTSFFNVVCFRDLAENAAESLGKGSRVIATGRLEVRQYETKDGEKRQTAELIADELGPSLRWATAEVTKANRREGGGGGGYGGGDDSYGGGGGRGDSYGGGNRGGSSGGGAPNYPSDDEEPF